MDTKRTGAKLVIIKMEKSELDCEADLVINGEKFEWIFQELDWEKIYIYFL
jgi:hypothetical protein